MSYLDSNSLLANNKKLLAHKKTILADEGNFSTYEKADLDTTFFGKFRDPCLVKYIEQALKNNPTAVQAGHTVEQHRQQVQAALGEKLPVLSVGAQYTGFKMPTLDKLTLPKHSFILPLSVNYELDLFSKNKDKALSAKKAYEISEHHKKAVYLSLLSDVATAYLNVLEYDQLLELARKNVGIHTELFEHEQKKFHCGTINVTQRNDAQTRLKDAENEFLELKRQQEILLAQLAVLVGISPTEAKNLQRGKLENFEYTDILPTEVSSEVIFSRPDVLAAEAALEKAKIDIRVARKEFLPTFNINGTWAFNTMAHGQFFSWGSAIASLLAGTTWTLFSGGRRKANLKMKKALYEELLEAYRQTTLNATLEINTALCFMKCDNETAKNTLANLGLAQNNYRAAGQKYQQGVIAYPELLSDLADFIRAQTASIRVKTQRLVNDFTFYKTVGGKL